MERKWVAVAVAAVFSGTVAAQVAQRLPPPRFGPPLAGLAEGELQAFEDGRDTFVRPETPETGLGPIFNGRSCVECHGAPAPGGASPINVTRFGRLTDGAFDPLEALGGTLLQRFSLDPETRERVPRDANVVAERQSTPLFGAGLVEAIADDAILANALRPGPEGVRGRAAMVLDLASGQTRVGRFGWKAQHATLLAFSADAYRNELGITNRFFPAENAPNGNAAVLAGLDTLADPEDVVDESNRSDVDRLADFMRLLAPPARLPLSPSARAGEGLFAATGCVQCHTPTLASGPHPVPALSEKVVALFSDLLLHDMGALNDGIGQGDARPNEMKTPPLWGLRASAPYLHDGRAATVDQAIRRHDGEGRRARERYEALPPQQRQQLLDFLNAI